MRTYNLQVHQDKNVAVFGALMIICQSQNKNYVVDFFLRFK